uniref:Uncharacterized protein n=2 Tax=Arthropoda TaxID=6656 RepID=A0A834VHH4_SARSC
MRRMCSRALMRYRIHENSLSGDMDVGTEELSGSAESGALSSVLENPKASQMPRHLISDAHEWINEIPTVPTYYLAKPQPRERAWQNQRGKKTLLSLTLV